MWFCSINTVFLLICQNEIGNGKDSPFAVLIHVSVRLHRILFDQELDALVEGNGNGGRLFAEQHFDGVVGGQAHDVLGADRVRTAFAVRAIGHAVYGEENKQ